MAIRWKHAFLSSVMAGLDPAIYVVPLRSAVCAAGLRPDVDGRNKCGHEEGKSDST